MPSLALKRIFLFSFLSLQIIIGYCQQTNTKNNKGIITLSTELKHFYDLSLLPSYIPHSIEGEISSYDTTGGNDDGFSGKYSLIRRTGDSNLVIFEKKGPGVINRIWTPTPSNDSFDFYIDDTSRPAFSICYRDLFSGKRFPFVEPLCGNQLGGFYCYLPIPFQKYCRIICRSRSTQFHQIQYRLFENGTTVKSFTAELNQEEKNELKKISGTWKNINSTLDYFTNPAIHKSTFNGTLIPGGKAILFKSLTARRIVGIRIDNANQWEGLSKNILIRIHWDDDPTNAVNCPLSDFFGFAFGKISMQSLLLGSKDNLLYANLPMPFDRSVSIELIDLRKKATAHSLPVKATIYFTNEKRNPASEGKLYSYWNHNFLQASQPSHILLNTIGKGHYVATILQAQGLQAGMTYFFEGDDSTASDGIPTIHGTGSEDYFNGGWYAFPDRWSQAMSLPMHGALDYSLPFCRTGGYRFYLNDKIPFEHSIFQSIEHGPVNNNIPVEYTSVAFYYADHAPGHAEQILSPVTVRIPDTLMIYPQLMKYTIWDNIAIKGFWLFNTGGESFQFTANNDSRIKISLQEIPPGTYQLYIDFVKTNEGCSFSFWQGQNIISDWTDSKRAGDMERVPFKFMGDIRLSELINDITIQFKTAIDANALLLNRLILIKKK